MISFGFISFILFYFVLFYFIVLYCIVFYCIWEGNGVLIVTIWYYFWNFLVYISLFFIKFRLFNFFSLFLFIHFFFYSEISDENEHEELDSEGYENLSKEQLQRLLDEKERVNDKQLKLIDFNAKEPLLAQILPLSRPTSPSTTRTKKKQERKMERKQNKTKQK